MASRPAFLSGARTLARPKPRERPERKPPERRPDRRTPGRKDPKRPRRKEPQPRKPPVKKPLPKPRPRNPLFKPGELPRGKPFGKWVPNTGTPVPLMKRFQVLKLARFARFLGPIGIALSLWELYDLYRQYQQMQDAETSDYWFCHEPVEPGRSYRWLGLPSSCNIGSGFGPGNLVWDPTRPWYQENETWTTPTNRDRYMPIQAWKFPNGPANPEDPLAPVITPVPVFPELPYPYPYSDEPLPWTPPLSRPLPEPKPDPYDPWKDHWERGEPEFLNRLPDITFEPGRPLRPDWHELRPPGRDEKEKKQRLKGKTNLEWWKFLNKGVGSFTEIDDAVAAIYKGLPWKYRRWRGRDGVWRDRDINTKSRTERLYQLIGKLDIETAVKELVKNELTDRAFGKVGNRLKKKTQELADEGLWGGFQGLGQNPNRFNDSWDEVYKKLKKEATERQERNGHNWYFTRTQDPVTRRWVGRWRQRPVTTIPWYRQRSEYDRTVHLTGQKTGYTVKRARYYYGKSHTY